MPASEPSSLHEAITQELRTAPGATVREILWALRDTPWTTDKKTANQTLYAGRPATFVMDGSTPPRWALASADDPFPVRPEPDAGPTFTEPERPPAPPVRPSPPPVPAPNSWGIPLHTWQVDSLHAWHGAGCQGIVEAVTGSGKTHVGVAAALRAAEEGLPTTVLVPSIDLQRQWVRKFEQWAPRLRLATVGGRPKGYPDRADVVIAVVNSAATTNLVRGDHGDLLVADEVHRYGADTWTTALRSGYTRRLGLTATLERGDDGVDQRIRPYFGASVTTYSFSHALRDGVVAPFRLLLLPIALTPEEREVYDTESRRLSDAVRRLRAVGAMGSASAGPLSQRLRQLAGAGGAVGRAAQSAEAAIRLRRALLAGLSGKLGAIDDLAGLVGASKGAVIFTQTRETADEVAHRLRTAGVPASSLHAAMDAGERAANLDALDRGTLSALSAPKLLDEGIDIPSVDLGIVTSSSRSTRQMVQRLGRVVRRKEDGRPIDFVILFAADTVEDPEDGAHEGFFDLVTDTATATFRGEVGWSVEDFTPS